jgi:stress-induced morphogen
MTILQIRKKLTEAFHPTSLVIHNDSYKHASHVAMQGISNPNSHLRVEIASSCFEGKKLPDRHRLVYSILKDELASGLLHALQIKAITPSESLKI